MRFPITPNSLYLSLRFPLKMSKFNIRICISFVIVSIFFFFNFSVMSHPSSSSYKSLDLGPVTPTIPLISFLEQIQETALKTFGPKNFDPKFYIDYSLKSNLSITKQAFDKLPRNQNGVVSKIDFEKFTQDYLNVAGNDLIYFQPPDFDDHPNGFLPKVKNPQVRKWALDVHALWKNLSRRVSPDVKNQPELHTLLPIPESCVIPGSRFKEVYYWDSYWVIRGLLASQMHKTATAIVTNLIYLVEKYGYVLNGARAYYTNRSQPPLLSSMVHAVYQRTGDMNLVKKALPALIKEHEFWNSGFHKVTIHDSKGCSHNFSRYYAMWNKPRPESSINDKETASKLSNEADKQKLYREVASAAESGWDFSTRWMRNSSDLATLTTTTILPVDLNAYILKMELDIAFLAKVAGEKSVALQFHEASQAREKAFNSIFWNEKASQWLDCWITCKDNQTWEVSHQNQNLFASNFVPLWIKPFDSASLAKKVMKSLGSSGLVRPFGIATSLTNSGQQWDYPNGWAPMQHLIIEGLAKSGSKEAYVMAEDIATQWLRSNYKGFNKSGDMHEKYDVDKCGEFGGGGEYVPQTGFGWTNGVVLALLEEFGWPQDKTIVCA